MPSFPQKQLVQFHEKFIMNSVFNFAENFGGLCVPPLPTRVASVLVGGLGGQSQPQEEEEVEDEER